MLTTFDHYDRLILIFRPHGPYHRFLLRHIPNLVYSWPSTSMKKHIMQAVREGRLPSQACLVELYLKLESRMNPVNIETAAQKVRELSEYYPDDFDVRQILNALTAVYNYEMALRSRNHEDYRDDPLFFTG